MKFALKEKKTFFCDSFVCINRQSDIFPGKFYYVEKTGSFYFNLPKGVYSLKSGGFLDSEISVNYEIQLPEFNYTEKLPKKVSVKFGNVDVKAMIYRKLGKVIIDKNFKKYPQYVFKFLLEHEKGHYYYLSDNEYSNETVEMNCDLFAADRMLNEGYNPSQIYEAVNVLGNSALAERRIENIKVNLLTEELIKSYE